MERGAAVAVGTLDPHLGESENVMFSSSRLFFTSQQPFLSNLRAFSRDDPYLSR